MRIHSNLFMTKVVTYMTPSGDKINLTALQVHQLNALGKWPKNSHGEEYCQVSHGLHSGTPIADKAFRDFLLSSAAHLSYEGETHKCE
jgi:hypothetical protein